MLAAFSEHYREDAALGGLSARDRLGVGHGLYGAVVDGLKGFPEAITAVFSEAMVQTCIVHVLRNSLNFVSYKDRKPVAAALKDIYRAAEAALSEFETGEWGTKYPTCAD